MQAAACLSGDVGVQCVAVAALSSSSVDTLYTYWFPTTASSGEVTAATATAAMNAGTFELFDASNDLNIRDDPYYSLDHFVITMSGTQSYYGSKFQLLEQSGYTGDYRWVADERYDVFKYQKDSSGTISWDVLESRLLKFGAIHTVGSIIVSVAAVVSMTF